MTPEMQKSKELPCDGGLCGGKCNAFGRKLCAMPNRVDHYSLGENYLSLPGGR